VTINYGHPVISSLYWHIFVGQAKGLFADEGIDLEPAFVASGVPSITQGTVSGTYELSSISADAGILAVERGAPLVYVGGEAHQAVFSIIVQPEITSWSAFKGQGKTIGAASVRGGTSTIFRWILSRQGLQDGPDYSFVAAGSTSERVAALQSKTIDAGLMAQPQDFQMADAGFRRLGLTTDYLPRYAIGDVAGRRDWVESHPDVVVRYLRANIRAMHWLYDPANRGEALAILEQYTKTQPDYAARTYDLLIDRLQMFARNGELDPAAFEGVMQVLTDEGELTAPAPPVSKYLDTRYWEQAIADVGRR
jgi:ABC-type nitrate/sulfonate/bicarbonate transport system substrate-binding protein